MSKTEKIGVPCCYCENVGFRIESKYGGDVTLFCKHKRDFNDCGEATRFLNQLKLNMKDYSDYNLYCYTVNTFLGSESVHLKSVQLHGKIWAISDYAAIRRVVEMGIVYPAGYEFLSMDDVRECRGRT